MSPFHSRPQIDLWSQHHGEQLLSFLFDNCLQIAPSFQGFVSFGFGYVKFVTSSEELQTLLATKCLSKSLVKKALFQNHSGQNGEVSGDRTNVSDLKECWKSGLKANTQYKVLDTYAEIQ